ncbi:uncharacterized protein LOC114326046 isoform X3 [Diabrotica virgifera virgifera]|nr:uncharacterized protein LOC114326046 isoform X3 [Diabrotica virgifera virgifera]
MSIVGIVFAALAVALVTADEISDCRCVPGHEARKDFDGVVKCHFPPNLIMLPYDCNITDYPPCICSGSTEPEKILTTAKGFECKEVEQVKPLKFRRWPCENKEEWEKYYEKQKTL